MDLEKPNEEPEYSILGHKVPLAFIVLGCSILLAIIVAGYMMFTGSDRANPTQICLDDCQIHHMMFSRFLVDSANGTMPGCYCINTNNSEYKLR